MRVFKFKNNTVVYTILASLCIILLITGRIYSPNIVFNNSNVSTVIFLIPSLILMISIYLGKNQIRVGHEYLLFFVVFLLFSIINFFFWGTNSYADNYSFRKFFTCLLIIIPLCTYLLTISKFVQVTIILNILFLVCTVLCIVIFYKSFQSLLLNERVEDIFGGGPIVLARWAALTILFAFFFSGINISIRVLIFVISLVCLIACQSKGPIISLLMCFWLNYLVNSFFKSYKRGLIYVISSFVFIFFINQTIQFHVDEGTLEGRLFVFWLSEDISNNESTFERKIMQESTLNMLSDYPLGVGLGNWSKYITNYGYILPSGDGAYPHNLFIELFSELGFVALISFIFIVIRGFIFSYKVLKLQKYGSFLFNAFLFYFFNLFFSGDLTDSRFLLFFALLSERYFSIYNDTFIKMER